MSLETAMRVPLDEDPGMKKTNNPDVDGRIEDWVVDINRMGEIRVIGHVYGDVKGRFPDGSLIKTSPVLEVRNIEKGGILRTLNSNYLLGCERGW